MQERKLRKSIHVYLAVLLCLSFIVSVVVYPPVSLSVPSYMLVYLAAPFFIAWSFFSDKGLLRELLIIAAVFLVLNLLAQLHVWWFEVSLDPSLTLTDKGDLQRTLLRPTFFGQSIYLFAGILTYLYLKHYACSSHLRYLYLGLRIIAVLGILEIILFQLTGVNGDVISNRVFNNKPGSGSLFQTITLGGLRMQRLKSLTGEPSMFAFAVIPFWMLCIPLKRYVDFVLLGIALLFTFSTSAYLGAVVLVGGASLADAEIRRKMIWFVPIGVMVMVILYFTSPAVHKLVQSVFIDKFTGSNQSGSERSGHFLSQYYFWKDQLSITGKLVGLGWGYVRSTDFFSTLLVNNGVLGLVAFTLFYFRHAFVQVKDAVFKKYYLIALTALFFILMGSVPEFAYLSLWIFLSLPYWVDREEKQPE
ncbi:hypothetical protein [Arcticibacter sp.]|uniref:hypothetical protein n=1 Tax=Arcticibacter sp. TaxID=1872630 RepID=UPI00388F5864